MIDVKELLEKGHIRLKAIINVVGKPKEHIELTMKGVVDKLNTEDEVKLVESKIFETEPAEDDMFSAFAEVDLLVKDLPALSGFCADYMPSSIEIEEPHTLTFQQQKMSSFVNEFLTKMHTSDAAAKQQNAANLVLAQTVRNVLKRSIMYALKQGDKTPQDLSDDLYVVDTEIETYLKTLETENLVIKNGEKYSLVK